MTAARCQNSLLAARDALHRTADAAVLGLGDDLVIVWQESGGPPVTEAPTRRGFGSELTDLSVERQLGGSIEREWLHDGLKVTVRLHVSRLYRAG